MFTGREIRSTIEATGKLILSIETVEVSPPGDDEVLVHVEAAPVNPTDLGLLLGPANVASLAEAKTADGPVLSFDVPATRLTGVRNRIGLSLVAGTEGAGTVVAAGRNAEHLLGKPVGVIGGGMYADYRRAGLRDVVVLPMGASAADGASMFVNPLTALGIVETARREGHAAIVHTAAASNLGQMLQKICLADGIPLINIIRSQAQEQVLRAAGADHVLNSTEPDFATQLTDLVEQTGATIAFDPIGGGSLGSTILQAMERAALRQMAGYHRYGSDTFKQLYIYGALDPGPVSLNRLGFGFQWSVSGWLLFPFLRKVGEETEDRLRQRVVRELTTTFASSYTKTIGLAQMLDPENLRSYLRMATGEKILVAPGLG